MKVVFKLPKSSVSRTFFYSLLLGFLIIAFTNLEKLTRSLDDLKSEKKYCGVVISVYLSQGRRSSASWILKIKSDRVIKTFNLSGVHFNGIDINRRLERGDSVCVSYLEPNFPRLSLFITQIENNKDKLLELHKVKNSFTKVSNKVWCFAFILFFLSLCFSIRIKRD